MQEPIVSPRRAELLGVTLRRFVRRGARGHVSKLLGKTRPEDVAIQLHGLTPAQQLSVFQILIADYPEAAAQVLAALEPPDRTALVGQLDSHAVAGMLETLPVDDAVAVVESLPPELHEKVLELVDRGDLKGVQAQLVYADETAGRIMDPAYFALNEDITVAEAVRRLQGSELENAFYLYLVDDDNHLVGVTSLRQLLMTPPERRLSEIASRSIIKAHTDTDQEEVARLAARYDLLAIPVTDGSNRLQGIVTVDDIIDVVKEEATEDFMRMAGTSEDELLYQERSLKVASIRLPWLLINLVGLAIVGFLMSYFQVNLKQALFLLTFVPLIMGMGGNIGSQNSTIAVRGLATGRIRPGEGGNARRFLWRQLKIGLVLGGVCALLAAGAAVLLEGVFGYSDASINLPTFAAVVGGSLFLAMLIASLNGSLIPLAFQRLGIDPAVASGPLVATFNDITGIIIYFGLASLLIDLLVR